MGYQDCVQFPHSHALLLSFKKSSGWDRTDFIIFKGCINGHITRRNVSDKMRRSDYRHSHEAKNIQKNKTSMATFGIFSVLLHEELWEATILGSVGDLFDVS